MKKIALLTAAAILIPALLFALAGCMKAPSTAIDKGPEVPCQVLDQTISSIQKPSVLSIGKSEFAYIESTARIENLSPELTQQYAVTVMDRQEDAYMVKLTIREETREKVDGQFKTSIKEGPALITKPTPTPAPAIAFLPKVSTLDTADLGVQEVGKKLRILSGAAGSQGANCNAFKAGVVKSFNKLEISNFDVPVPAAVRARADCGGLKNCDGPLQGKNIKFDRWIADPNNPGKEMKVTTYLVTVAEVPFFATVFSQCIQYSWPALSRQVLVTSCDDVKDFKFGTPP